MATHSCGISARSGVHHPGYALCIPPHILPPLTPLLHNSLCLPDIQTSFPKTVLHSINSSLPRPTHWTTTNTSSNKDTLSNPIPLHPLHIQNHQRTLSPLLSSSPFVTPYNSIIRAFGTLSIPLIPSKPQTLSICTGLFLDLTFFFHQSFSLPYVTTDASNVLCKTLAHSIC